MTKPLNLPEPTICDMNCFFLPNHNGPHQYEDQLGYFQRESKAKAYEVCKERGHTAANYTLTSNPPLSVCEFCGTHYRYEQRLIESNIPK